MVEQIKDKVSLLIKLSYGLADAGFIIMATVVNTYFMFFLTEMAGITAAVAATIMMTVRLVDMIAAPIWGSLVEKSNLKWGKYRSWLILAPYSIAIGFILMFTNFNISQGPKVVVAFIAYLLWCVSCTFVYCSYNSLTSTLTTEKSQRVALSTARGQGNAVGKIVAGWTILPLIAFFGGGAKTAQGYFWTAICVALFMILCYRILFQTTKGKAYFAKYTKKEDKVKLIEMIKQVLGNKPLVLLILTDMARFLNTFILFGMFPYFFKYVVGNMRFLPVFFGMLSILLLGGSTIVPLVSKKLSKRNTYRLGNAILAICLILMYMNKTNVDLLIIFASIGYVGYAFANVINTAMLADTVEYGEWKTGKNIRAFVMVMFNFSVKFAAMISSSIVGFGLAAVGFVANTAPTPQVVNGIGNIAMLLPAGLLILGIILLTFYKLDDEMLVKIRKEIAERKAN